MFGQNDIISNNQNTKHDTIREITTIGIFDGNYIGKTGYKLMTIILLWETYPRIR